METSLHRELKLQYGSGPGGRSEVALKGYRVDAITPEGAVVEVQSGPLGPLRQKLRSLLPEHSVRVVKPIVVARRIVRRARTDGVDLSARLSPKKGAVVEVFDDLVGLARVFPHPNLRVDVLAIEIDEIRVPGPRRSGYSVVDRKLRRISETVSLSLPADLVALLPGDWTRPFTTSDLAERLRRPIAFAQRVAYCLRNSGAVITHAKSGNRRIYLVVDP